MDVNTMTRIATANPGVGHAYGKDKAKAAAAENVKDTANATAAAAKETKDAKKAGKAFNVAISSTAKKAAEAPKGMTAEQIDTLKQGIEKSQQLMIKVLSEQNAKLQGYLDKGVGKLNFEGVLFGTDRFALPAVGTTPEEAAAAVGEGGAYSVDAVAGRIMDMATAIAGNDPEKLQKMQAAVEKGFAQAGAIFKKEMGVDDMPQITKDTQAEITKRFQKLYDDIAGKTAPQTNAQL